MTGRDHNPEHEPASSAPWSSLSVEVAPRFADELIGLMGEELLGGEVNESVAGVARVTLTYGSDVDVTAARSRLDSALGVLGLDPAGIRVDERPIQDGEWVKRYQAGLKPFDIGTRFTVDPTGRAKLEGGRTWIRLIPGRAFGTGEHPTTRLCTELLERYVRNGDRWLDVGCGTGILSLVAAHCGAAHVLALDADTEAVAVTRETLASDTMGTRVDVAVGSFPEESQARQGVVCNISAAFLVEYAGALAHAVLPRGRVLVSGFLECDAEGVRQALQAVGLQEQERLTEDGWVAMLLEPDDL